MSRADNCEFRTNQRAEIVWARRVSMRDIFRLYEELVCGITDNELVEEIAHAFYSRCLSIVDVQEALNGHVRCQNCRKVVLQRQTWQKNEILRCPCGWKVTWDEFFRSYHRKQLTGGTAYPFFLEYVERLPKCKTMQERILLIDWIIHQCHISILPQGKVARPAACNLIDGRMNQLISFLNELPNAPHPVMQEEFRKWKDLMAETMRPIG